MTHRVEGTRFTRTLIAATDKAVLEANRGYRCSQCPSDTPILVSDGVSDTLAQWHILIGHRDNCTALSGQHSIALDVIAALANRTPPT